MAHFTIDPSPTYALVHAFIARGDQSYWTRVGIAYRNRDGSMYLKLDLVTVFAPATLYIDAMSEHD